MRSRLRRCHEAMQRIRHKMKQRITQVDEAKGMQRSGQEEEAEEKQTGSQDEERAEKH